MATGKELLNYVYDKVISVPETVQPPSDEDQSSMMDQLSGFLKNLHLPSRSDSHSQEASQAAEKTEE